MKNITAGCSLSVIIPCFNMEKYVKRAINSIVYQPNIECVEMIVIDDGSFDGTPNMCDEYCLANDGIIVMHQPNNGVSCSRNRAIKLSGRGYIAFLDADDFWDEGFLTNDIIDIIFFHDMDLYAFSYRIVSQDYRYALTQKVLTGRGEHDIATFGSYSWYHFCSVIYKRALLYENTIEFFDVKYSEDALFAEAAFCMSKNCEYIDKIIFNQYSNTSSVSHSIKSIKRFDECYRGLDLAKAWYQERNIAFDVEYGVLMDIAAMLPDICADMSYRKSRLYFENDVRYSVLKQYRQIEMSPNLDKKITAWMERPFLYWLKAKTLYRAERGIKDFLTSKPLLRKLVNRYFYKRRGYEEYHCEDSLKI